MPTDKSCKKRILTAAKSRARNRRSKTYIHNATKKLEAAKGTETTAAELKTVFSVLDKAVKAGVLHKNTAANRKSKLSRATNKKAA